MKKTPLCALALMLIMLAALAACGGTPQKSEPDTATERPSADAEAVPAESAASDAESGPENKTIRAGTAGELLEAIAPGTVIELAPGVYDLTAYLDGAADDISDYVARGFCFDGWQAEINGVEGLTIRGAESGVEIVAEPRHANVLFFSACSDITIENITFGHTVEQGSCEGAVLGFERCRNVALSALDLYGCGTYGVAADHTTGIALTDSVIRDCSYGIVSLNVCGGVTAKDCAFRGNSGYDLISLYDSFALFDGCAFTGNAGDEFLRVSARYGDDSGARFERCAFGSWESERLGVELRDHGNYMLGTGCRFEGGAGRRIVRASSVEQLIENIAPDTEILLAPGRYDLSKGIAGLLEKKGESFAESLAFVRIDEEYDGPELVVTGVSGLTIASESGCAADTEIVTDPRYANVIRFENCSGVGVMDLTMGHTERGECVGDVLYFSGCGGVVLHGLDLYGCGVYGVGANQCGRLSCFDSTIRDCAFGALELYAAQERQLFVNCVMTGSGGGGCLSADEGSNGTFCFYRCAFGEQESNSFAFDAAITAEDCDWSEITEYPDYFWEPDEYEPVPLDTTRLKNVPFDARVLTDEHYYICYEAVDRQSGEVSLEPDSAVRILTFEEGGAGDLLAPDGERCAFRYAMDSDYSGSLLFDDGRKGDFSLCADRGGALPESEEGQLWLRLHLDDEVLWFY